MDIRNWPIDRIMQLPDCCFGRRWPVGVYATAVEIGTYYDISEAGLGDRCVVWQVSYISASSFGGAAIYALSLGDVLPVNDAQFDALDPIFSDVGRRIPARRGVDVGETGQIITLPLRYPVQAQGRRLVGRFEIISAPTTYAQMILVISSFPTEVPEWLISGQGRGQ